MAGELSPALLARTRRFAPHSRQSCAFSLRLLCVARTRHWPAPPTTGRSTGPQGRPQEELNHRKSEEASEPRAGRAARACTTGRQTEPSVRSALNNAGLRPSPHPVFSSTFLPVFSRSLSKRGVSRLRPHHTAHPPIGSELPRPFSCQPRRRKGAKTRALALVSWLLFTPGSRTPF